MQHETAAHGVALERRVTLKRRLASHMISLDELRMALQVPRRNPGRSFLTTLGLAIGVGSFIAMVSFGRGARSSVVSQFETLGANLLFLKPSREVNNAHPQDLTEKDVDALHREATTLAYVVPEVTRRMDVVYGRNRYRTTVRGVTHEFQKTRNEPVAEGGVFDVTDEQQRSKVCLIGAVLARQLFGANEDPLGAVVTISAAANTLPCRIIGLLAEQGSSLSGANLDDRLVMPLSTYEAQFGLGRGYSAILLRPKDRALVPAARQEVADIIRRLHHVEPEDEDDFHILSPDEVTRIAEQIAGILTALLAGIASVSLLVGGIGIMNILLVSVAERTQEIGVRAAIGGSPRQIMRQFLAEAVVLATLGSLAGAVLGVGSALAVARQLGWPSATAPDIVIGSVSFGVLVGTLFGYLPAKRAADLDPIEALRRE